MAGLTEYAAAALRAFEKHILLLVFRCSARRTIQEVQVAIAASEPIEAAGTFDKIDAALALLKAHAHPALRWLRTHSGGILVFQATEALAEWNSEARLVVLDERFVGAQASTVPQVASAIVHEATHARLDALGFEYIPERRARIEAVCFRRERAFGRRLFDGDLVVSAQQQLARDPAYLTDEAFRHRTARELVSLGMPAWLIRFIERLAQRRIPVDPDPAVDDRSAVEPRRS